MCITRIKKTNNTRIPELNLSILKSYVSSLQENEKSNLIKGIKIFFRNKFPSLKYDLIIMFAYFVSRNAGGVMEFMQIIITLAAPKIEGV